MTEPELRQKLVETAKSYLGCKESDGSHKKIIDIYNAHEPLAVGYALKYTDAWCSAFVSAMSILCGLTDILPTECGCQRHIELFRELGAWVEDDTYVPQIGDVIFYAWSDDGKGDCTARANHVGIVTECDGKTITVIEGNISNAVGYRTIAVGGQYIRGYGVPKYATKADSGSDWSKDAREWAIANGIIRGRGNADGSVDFAWKENVTREEMAVMLYRFAAKFGSALVKE